MAKFLMTPGAALALTFGLLVGIAPASAAPVQTLPSLGNPGLTLVDYARSKKKSQVYSDQYTVYGSRRVKERAMPFGGSDEIRALQQAFPETNWPRSMRYFD